MKERVDESVFQRTVIRSARLKHGVRRSHIFTLVRIFEDRMQQARNEDQSRVFETSSFPRHRSHVCVCRRQLEKSRFAPVRNVTRLGAG